VTKNVRSSGLKHAVVNPLTYQIHTKTTKNKKITPKISWYHCGRNVEAEDINSFDEFKRNVFAIIDKLTSEMNRRFSDRNKKTMRGIDALTHTRQKTF